MQGNIMIFFENVTQFKYFGNESKKSKFDSEGNEGEIEFE
jgi:hypothetical protein